MKKWQQFTVLNFGMLLGIFASLFIVPGETPAWLWAVICVALIAAMNYLLLRRLRHAAGRREEQARGSNAIIAVGFVIFVIDLIFRVVHHSR